MILDVVQSQNIQSIINRVGIKSQKVTAVEVIVDQDQEAEPDIRDLLPKIYGQGDHLRRMVGHVGHVQETNTDVLTITNQNLIRNLVQTIIRGRHLVIQKIHPRQAHQSPLLMQATKRMSRPIQSIILKSS